MGFGLKMPDIVGIAIKFGNAARHMDHRVIVFAARFKQQDPVARVTRQAFGKHAPGRSAADNDKVPIAHGFLMLQACDAFRHSDKIEFNSLDCSAWCAET